MTTRRVLPSLIAVAVAGIGFAGCGGDTSQSTTTVTTTKTVTTTTTVTTPTTPTSPTTTTTPTSPTPVTLEQPAIWPAPGVEFIGAARAARDFVTKALDVPVNLGPYRAGDARSGEIEVRFAGEGGGLSIPRSTLLLRKLGPRSTWYVLAAVNDNASITSPASASKVPAGTVTVKGKARGFEGAVSVTAFVAGNARRQLDQEFTIAGSMETPQPFSVKLDLSGARSGQTVVILVRGGVGLETDPGEFGAIPVVIR